MDSDEDLEKDLKDLEENESYESSRQGIENALHGCKYQISWIMYIAVTSLLDDKEFTLATEMADAGKFDDVVYGYKEGGKTNYRLIQVKHCSENKEKKLDLSKLQKKDDPYYLEKYYNSYEDLIQKERFMANSAYLVDLIICTNIDCDGDLQQMLKKKKDKDRIILEGERYEFKDSYTVLKKLLFGVSKNNRVRDFVKKLVLAVKQPCQDTLRAMIKERISDKYRFCGDLMYEYFMSYIIGWTLKKTETNKRYPLERKNLEKFFHSKFKELHSKVNFVQTSESYITKLKAIAFKYDTVKLQNIKDFINNQDQRTILNEQILMIYQSKRFLTAVKVYQVLESIGYPANNYIFLDLESLCSFKGTPADPIKMFNRPSDSNLVIIEHNTKGKEIILNSYFDVLVNNPKKKIILISSNEQKAKLKDIINGWVKKLPVNKKIKWRELEDKSKLTDLTDESQKMLLNKKGTVIFQGKEVSLGTLIKENTKHLISGEVLVKVINDEKIEIGPKLEDQKYNEIKEFYIERKFTRYVIINKDIVKEKSKFFIIDEEKPVLPPNYDGDVLVISENESLFEELCNDSRNKNIHLLREEENEFVWLKSNGNLSELRKFKIKNEQGIISYEAGSIEDKVVIIVAEPGMGKSTVLSHIALRKKDSLIFKVNLEERSSDLKNLMKCNGKETLFKLLYSIFLDKCKEPESISEDYLNYIEINMEDNKLSCTKGEECKLDDVSWFKIQLFNEQYNQGKIVFMFDGYDEICPHYKRIVMELFKVLKQSEATIWITTRPYNIVEELENELGVFSYSLRPFSKNEQCAYLKKLWRVNDDRSDSFVEGLINGFAESIVDTEMKFLSNPLHIKMLADDFREIFNEWCESDIELFYDYKKFVQNNLSALFEKFLYIKFYNIHIKGMYPEFNTDVPGLDSVVKVLYDKCLEDHMKLAACSLLSERHVGLFLTQPELNLYIPQKMEEIKSAEEKTGIITHVADNKPVFVHRTFALYFLSLLIFNKLVSKEISEYSIELILLKDDHSVISLFLNGLMNNYANIQSKTTEKVSKNIAEDASQQVHSVPSLLVIHNVPSDHEGKVISSISNPSEDNETKIMEIDKEPSVVVRIMSDDKGGSISDSDEEESLSESEEEAYQTGGAKHAPPISNISNPSEDNETEIMEIDEESSGVVADAYQLL